MSTEIWVASFFGVGHILSAMELCKHIASRGFKTTLVVYSNLSDSIRPSFTQYPLIQILEIPSPPPQPPPPGSDPMLQHRRHHSQMASGLEKLLSTRPDPDRPICAILDVMMGFAFEVFQKFQVPTVAFFTSGACSAAMEYATWKADTEVIRPDEVPVLPGYLDLIRRPHGPPRPPPDSGGPPGLGADFPPPPGLGSKKMGPPEPGNGCFLRFDFMMSIACEVFQKFQVPFFTSGACSAAMEYATWKAHPDIRPDEVRLLPGLPEDMALTYLDRKRLPHGQPRPTPDSGGPSGLGAGFPPALGLGSKKMGPPEPGNQPPWMEEAGFAIALLINTCDDLERAFIDYIAHQIGKPVWGVGPLLPEQYWRSAGSLLHDREIRTNRRSSITEDEAIQWLDSKPRGSVLYVSFGSEVGPTMEEYLQLAGALEEWSGPFIWVIQPDAGRSGPPRAFTGGGGQGQPEEGYYPHGLESKVGERGLIIREWGQWAPQLLILSHPSTGGFLSHCGWNSTVEGIGRGVPFLVWPIREDQYYDAKLVVCHLAVGYMIADDPSQKIKKEDIVKGIEKLMGDEDVKKRAVTLSTKFQQGFPATSVAALDAFRDFINHKLDA